MSNKHKYKRVPHWPGYKSYPGVHKVTFTMLDCDYQFYYEAMKLMPEPIDYNLMEDEPETLVLWVQISGNISAWEEKYLNKVAELKHKYDISK